MKKLKAILSNCLLAIASTVTLLFILEIILRTWGTQGLYTPFLYPKAMIDTSLVTTMRPNFEGDFPKSEIKGHIKINSKGLRDKERPYEKNNKYRILGLGDSFAFGHGMESEESYLSILEKLLQEQKDSTYEVIKAAAPAIGPQRYLTILQNEGLKYNPDLVLVSFFTGNDVSDIDLSGWTKVKPKQKKTLKDFLRENIHLYSFIVDRAKTIPSLRKKMQEMNIASGLIGSHVIDVLKKNDTTYQTKWNEVFKILGEMKTLSGSTLVIVIIPTREQCDSIRMEKALKQLGYKKDDIDIYKPNNLIRSFCDSNNIMCIDLLPEFKKSEQPLYFEIDPHFNKEGNRLAAKIIYEALNKTGTISREQ